MFIHIPIPEFLTLYNTMPVYGRRGEGIGCPLINTGFGPELITRGVIFYKIWVIYININK